MGRDPNRQNGLSIVLIDGMSGRSIVPTDGDHWLPVSEDSVTVEAIRRAARRIGERQRGTHIAAIAEATIDGRRCRPDL